MVTFGHHAPLDALHELDTFELRIETFSQSPNIPSDIRIEPLPDRLPERPSVQARYFNARQPQARGVRSSLKPASARTGYYSVCRPKQGTRRCSDARLRDARAQWPRTNQLQDLNTLSLGSKRFRYLRL